MEQEAADQVSRGYALPGNLQAAKGPLHSMVLDSRCSLTAVHLEDELVVSFKIWVEIPAAGAVLTTTKTGNAPVLRSMLLNQICQQHCSPPPEFDCSSVSTAWT